MRHPSLDTPRARVVVRAALGALALGAALALPPPPAGADARIPERAAPAGSGARLTLGPTAATAPGDLPTGRGVASEVDAIALDSSFELEVRGLLAELRLVQRFENGTAHWRDGRYAFPMPEGATPLGLEIRTGGRTIRGAVMEREAADGAYRAAAAAGQVAAVVDRERPNLFTVRVASIAPGARVSVALDVALPVEVEDGAYRLALPTTLVPRYVNEDVTDPAAVVSPVLPATHVRGPRVRLEARVAGRDPGTLASPTHRLTVDGDGVVAEAPADRDLVLRWPLGGAGPRGELHAVAHAGHRYVQLLLEPPGESGADATDGAGAAANDPPPRPRELILVLDRSGSMAGEPIRAARAAAEAALDRLRPGDTFNVIAFDDGLAWAFDASRPATADALASARRFVRGLDADGGTEIRPALERALATSAGGDTEGGDAAGRLVQVVFVTDGAIGYEDALLADVARGIGARRLFTVGIGAAPNRWFLERAAEIGRGTATFVADTTDVEAGIGTLLERLAEPVLTDLVAGPTAGTLELLPDPLPDLYADRPLMLVARIDDEVREIVVTGIRRGERWRRAWAVPDARGTRVGTDGAAADAPAGDETASGRGPASPVPAIASLWTSRRIDRLLDAQRTAANPERHRDEILALALDAGLASPYTSFVAVDETPVRPAGANAHATAIANLSPAGTTMQALHMPQGALGLPAAYRLALLLALVGIALAWLHVRLGRANRPARADARA